jgi:hypothetical protein
LKEGIAKRSDLTAWLWITAAWMLVIWLVLLIVR